MNLLAHRFTRAFRRISGVSLIFLFWPAVAASAMTLSVVQRPALVSAFGSRVVWSVYRPGSGRFVLVEHSDGGTRRVAGVRSRSVPFDVELGPGPHGLAAVYSRCAREPVSANPDVLRYFADGRGCRIYRYDFGRHQEREVALRGATRASSAVLPAVWHGVLAFVLKVPRRAPQIVIDRPEGPRQVVPGGTDPGLGPGPRHLSLRGSRLVFSWSAVVDQCSPTPANQAGVDLDELWSYDLRRRAQTRLIRGCEQDPLRAFLGPTLMSATRVRFGAESTAGRQFAVRDLDLATGAQVASVALPPTLEDVAFDGPRIYAVDRVAAHRWAIVRLR